MKSNAIVLVQGGSAGRPGAMGLVGMGAGQPSRVAAVEIAVQRAGQRAGGSVLASDAFFPKADGVEVLDERVDGGYPTAVTEGANNDATYVGRIREDISHERGLDMWVVSDNVRKGAALNSVQIAEILIKQYL